MLQYMLVVFKTTLAGHMLYKHSELKRDMSVKFSRVAEIQEVQTMC